MSASNSFEYDNYYHEGGGGENPQSDTDIAMTITRNPDTALSTRKIMETVLGLMNDCVRELVYRDIYNIALVIYDCSVTDKAVSAIRSPVSTCRAVSLTVLRPTTSADAAGATATTTLTSGGGAAPSSSSSSSLDDARAWLKKYSIDPDITDILMGDEGYSEILTRDTVDAIYLFVPAELQRHYVLAALQAGKHVLLKDVVSTPGKDFREQLDCAKVAGKFVQFSTMFLHHYRVQSFVDCVCSKKTFGSIQLIDAILTVNLQELEQVNVSLPLTAGQGCIRRLARYCVLAATLFLRAQQTPVRATVTECSIDDESGEPFAANCRVEFSGGTVLQCYVAYSSAPTRQVLTVKSESNKFGTMTDFVIPHPDGLATYRVYDKVENEFTSSKMDILQGDSLDVRRLPVYRFVVITQRERVD